MGETYDPLIKEEERYLCYKARIRISFVLTTVFLVSFCLVLKVWLAQRGSLQPVQAIRRALADSSRPKTANDFKEARAAMQDVMKKRSTEGEKILRVEAQLSAACRSFDKSPPDQFVTRTVADSVVSGLDPILAEEDKTSVWVIFGALLLLCLWMSGLTLKRSLASLRDSRDALVRYYFQPPPTEEHSNYGGIRTFARKRPGAEPPVWARKQSIWARASF